MLNFKFFSLVIIGIFLTVLIFNFASLKKLNLEILKADIENFNERLITSVSAKEIYPLFECPCCGKPIDTGCCGLALERQDYVDGLTQGQLSKDEIVMAYVKKYGLNSFINEEKQQEYREMLIEEAPADRPVISLIPSLFDFGDVSQKEGVVTVLFSIENKGENDLTINRLETSCGCTSASIIFQGKEGPIFNMPGHDINEQIEGWRVTIAMGEKAQLKVYYDPDVHEDLRGIAIRTISVFSNDPIDFEKSVKIELNQVD